MEHQITIRTYGFSELALLYFPNSANKKSAANQFKRWINKSISLKHDLINSGYANGNRVFTPLQVSLIVSYFGMP